MKYKDSILPTRPENLMMPMERKEESKRKRNPSAKMSKEDREESEIAGFQELAIAVIMQAWLDASHWRDSYSRGSSRRFLTAQTNEWRESLENWCGVCGKDPKGIIQKARRMFWDKEKIEQYRKMGR